MQANDKLVDLVSVLTNKINKNVKEIQLDIIDHYDGNYRKLEDLESLGNERVEELVVRVEERRVANEALKKKILDLQMKQKDLYEKCNQLECNITDLTDTHHEVSSKFDADLESHLQKINDFQVKEDETSAKNQRELQIMNDDLKQSMTTMKEEIEKVTTNLDGEIDAHSATEKENFKKITTDIEKIDKRIDGHLEKHKVSFRDF